VGLAFFFLAVIAIGFFLSYQSVTALLWAQRANSLTTLMGGIQDNTDLYFENTWADLDHLTSRISSQTYADEASLTQEISTISNERNDDSETLLYFYSSGRSVDSTGKVFVYDDYAGATKTYTHSLAMADMTGANGSGKESVLFFSKFATPLSVNGEEVTYLAKKVETATLDAFFSQIRLNDQSAFYLINPDGTRIYHQEQQDSLVLTGFNLLESLKTISFTNGSSYDSLVKDLNAKASGTSQVSLDGKAYMLSYASLATNDWYLLMSVPSDSVAAAVLTDSRKVLVSFTLAYSAIVIAGAIVVGIFVYNAHQKELSAQREEALARIAEEEKKASVAKTTFLSSVSHDIRTPINGIIGMLAIAQENPSDTKTVTQCLTSIEKSSNHLLSLINDVLDMSRIEAGKMELKNEPYNLLGVLDGCLSIIQGELDNREVAFSHDTSRIKHPYVRGDKVRLQRIVTNILGNSVKFTPDGHSIGFVAYEEQVSETTMTLRMEFTDTGIGMSEEFQRKIFEPFSQEDRPESTAYKGTGLGMAITKQYVDAMGGTLTLHSELDKGTSFSVSLPMTLATPAEILSLNQAPIPVPILKDKTILIVEDNEINLQIALHLLEQTQCHILVARDGEEAVKAFKAAPEGSLSLILMDVMMPVLNGYEATQQIRALERPDSKTVPIIAMTANAFQEDIEKAKSAGMNGHLAKPIDRNRFYQLLASYASGVKAS
jgi:signal transduction histidine kinase/ActR/RegA family two-component response regulator